MNKFALMFLADTFLPKPLTIKYTNHVNYLVPQQKAKNTESLIRQALNSNEKTITTSDFLTSD